jgi:hypothetical protein
VTPETQATQMKINKLDYIKILNFGASKELIIRVKRHP